MSGRSIADTGNGRARKLALDGTISTVAGGSESDRLVRPAAAVIDPDAALVSADTGGHRVVKVALR